MTTAAIGASGTGVDQVLHEPGRGPAHDTRFMRIGAGADHAAQAGGAELEAAVEPGGQLCPRRRRRSMAGARRGCPGRDRQPATPRPGPRSSAPSPSCPTPPSRRIPATGAANARPSSVLPNQLPKSGGNRGGGRRRRTPEPTRRTGMRTKRRRGLFSGWRVALTFSRGLYVTSRPGATALGTDFCSTGNLLVATLLRLSWAAFRRLTVQTTSRFSPAKRRATGASSSSCAADKDER